MNNRYLFGAEVNKIQSTLFAASLQRQVVGGSRLLAVFSEQAGLKAINKFAATKTIICAGGKFRLLFADEYRARDFGRYLVDSYRLLLDGPVTVAYPVLFDEDKAPCTADAPCDGNMARCFVCAEQEVARQLNQFKESRHMAIAHAQSPPIAFCQSSGLGLAERVASLTVEAETDADQINQRPENNQADRQYMSQEAYAMKEAGHALKKGRQLKRKEEDTSFLGRFARHLPETYADLPWAYLPEDDLAKYDMTRNNIAYMVADGNNMGTYFSQCQSTTEAEVLSEAVDKAIEAAIVVPLIYLIARLEQDQEHSKKIKEAINETIKKNRDKSLEEGIKALKLLLETELISRSRRLNRIPALPLIVAGDDIFVMLPAPYALDFSRLFCLTFETEIAQNDVVKRLLTETTDLRRPTMSASIVICKASYPYHLAHQRGETLQKQTKQLAKRVGRENDVWLSAVSFDVIVGSELVRSRGQSGEYRSAPATYWATDLAEMVISQWPKDVRQAAVNLRTLLGVRYDFQRLPAKRRAEVRELFAPSALPKTVEEQNRWDEQLEQLRERIKATDVGGRERQLEALDHALKSLANTEGKAPGYWLWRTTPKVSYAIHGLPNLLQIWHYAQSFDYPLEDYRKELES